MKSLPLAMLVVSSILGADCAVAENVPFPGAMQDANVSLSSMRNGQTESLMLGNGDLYGIVWDNDGSLFMRITKNDIWDARVDTSKDSPPPHVNVSTREITGSTGAPPSYALPYPHPRCAAAIRFGDSDAATGAVWSCIRKAPSHRFLADANDATAIMEVAGKVGASTGYRATLSGTYKATRLQFRICGSQNALYYVNVYDEDGKNILFTGWKKSPEETQLIELDFSEESIGSFELYTWTTDGKIAKNTISEIALSGSSGNRAIALPSAASDSTGTLDLLRAVATIERDKPAEIRILADRNVVLIRSEEAIHLEAITSPLIPAALTGVKGEVAWLHQKLPGDASGDWAGMEYALAVAVRGNLKAVSLVSSYDIKTGDVLAVAIELAEMTIRCEESQLVETHETHWQQFWSRSGIQLADKDLQRWWYRMLYFAKTVCKPGAAPVALMPPLATDETPWHADYHHNYNAWQAFWPLPAANHSELADPWISYVDGMLPRFQFLAKDRYDLDGACFPISSFLHEPDPKVCKSRNHRQLVMGPWGLTIGMAGMTVQSMWQRHLCDPDPEYMKAKIYPTLREVARFYVGFMEQCKLDDQGRILLGPSYSPEHGKVGIDNCPFDIAYVHYTFDAFLQASTELNTDQELAKKCRKYKSLLGDYPTALDKEGKPVVVDWLGCKYKQVAQHNIEVPASPVFPGDQVTWFSPEPQKELFRRTIMDTTRTGNNSHVMLNIAKARLSMPEAITDAKAWFVPRTLPNGFIQFPWAHGTFMQEMIGVAGLVNELLLQSVDNKIRVFPCWPEDQDAAFVNLRAQGGFLVSASWSSGKVTYLKIDSTVGGTLQLLSPWEKVKVRGQVLKPDARGIISLETRENESLIFSSP